MAIIALIRPKGMKMDQFLWYMLQPCTNFRVVAGNPNMVVALAGNKADLEDKRKVTTEVSAIFFFFYCYSTFFYMSLIYFPCIWVASFRS
jgi:hypothetical protein